MVPRIGMRNIKTSTSVFLCLLLFELLNRENSIQACIAAVICMQNTIVDSFKKGAERVIGTIIGGIAGGLVLFFVTTFAHEDLLIFIIPLGIVILIEICVTIDMKQSVVICCVVYLGILITRDHEGGYVLYTLNRVTDTTVGIMITLFVNKYMNLPDEFKKSFGRMKTETEQKEIEDPIFESAEGLREPTDEKTVPNIENNEKN